MARKRNTKKVAPEQPAPGPVAEDVKLFQPIRKDGSCGLTRADQIVHEEVEWLVPSWINHPGVVLIGGKSGTGKSTFLTALAAQVAGYQPLLPTETRPASSFLWYASEESIKSKVGPRLAAYGSILHRGYYPCHGRDGQISQRLFLPGDLRVLQEHIEQTRASLVIFDPITSFLGDGFSPLDNLAVRQLVEGLEEVCRRVCVTLCFTLHDRKSGEGSTVDHFSGAASWTQTPRVVLRFGKDANQKGRYILSQELNRLSEKAVARYYTLRKENNQVMFQMGSLTEAGLEETLEAPLNFVERSALAEAKEFLLLVLANGPMKTETLQQLAQKDGLHWGTIRRAKIELGIPHVKKSDRGTVWTEYYLPDSLKGVQP